MIKGQVLGDLLSPGCGYMYGNSVGQDGNSKPVVIDAIVVKVGKMVLGGGAASIISLGRADGRLMLNLGGYDSDVDT